MAQRLDVSNKMGEMPVKTLLLDMGIPIMISMLVQALYNVVDGVFVAQLSENALTAVSMAFPMQNLIIAFAVGNGVGINANLSKALGCGDRKRANSVAKNGLLLQGLSYLIFLIAGIFAVEPYMRAQTDNQEILNYGVTYLRIVLCLSIGVFVQISFERFLQSTGRAKYSMYTQLSGAVFNIVFDPILIFGLLGFPKMGVAGAAVATVGGQFFAAAMGFFLNLKKNPEVSLSYKDFKPDGIMLADMCRVSVPSIAMSSIISLTMFLMDLILKNFSSTAVAVFGVYGKLQSFVFMPVFGLNNAIVPIIAYNYGANKPERIHQTIKYGILYATGILVVGLIIMQTMPNILLRMYDASDYMMSIGVPAFRIISTSFVFVGVNIVCSSGCQAFGKGVYSLIISVIRQIAALLPIAWLFSLTGKLDLVWLCFPISEAIATCVSVPLLRRVIKKAGMDSQK